MSHKKLIIISGLPGTGKTTISKRIANEYQIPVLNRDGLKEVLFDSLGWSDREWSRKLGKASYALLYELMERLFQYQDRLIVESNFNAKFDLEPLQKIIGKYDLSTLQIVCHAEGEILWKRFQKRSESGERHPGHVDSGNYAEFKELLMNGHTYESLPLKGEVLRVDTTDFEGIDYPALYTSIRSFLS